MACSCFDFCNGAVQCLELPDGGPQQTCINACLERGMGFFAYRTTTLFPNGTPRTATCADDLASDTISIAPFIPNQSIPDLRYYDPGGVTPGKTWDVDVYNVTTGVIYQSRPMFACFPDGFSAVAGSNNDATDSSRTVTIYATDGPHLLVSNSASDYRVPVPAGHKVRITLSALQVGCLATLTCCKTRAIPPAPTLGHPARMYPLGYACFEGNLKGTPCNYRPCCRRGELNWPPYPTGSGWCDLRDPSNCLPAPENNYLWFSTPHPLAYSCYFPGTCSHGSACGDSSLSRSCKTYFWSPMYPANSGDAITVSRASVSVRVNSPSNLCAQLLGGLRYVGADAAGWTCSSEDTAHNGVSNCGLVYDALGDAQFNCSYVEWKAA